MDHDGEFDAVRPCPTPCRTPCFAIQVFGHRPNRAALPDVSDPVHPGTSSSGASQQLSTQQLLAHAVVQMAVQMTARMFGLSRVTVIEIVAVGLPLIATMAEGNPELRQRLYVASLAGLPERTEDFYARMTASPPVRQAVMDDYKATYGAMLDVVNRAAGRRAGTTDGQAREVIAAALPAVTQLLGTINCAGDEQSFCRLLRDLRM